MRFLVWWLVPGLLVLGGLACGKVVPPPSLRAGPVPAAPLPASAEPQEAAAPAEAAVSTPASAASFSLHWSAQTYPWSKGLAITAGGEILVQATRRVSLWSPRDKKLLAEQEVCFTFPQALGLLDERTAALVCEGSIELLSLPKLALSRARALPASARVAAFGGKLVAVGFAAGPVRVLSTSGWQEQAAMATAAEPSALALSADGRRLAIGLPTGEVAVHDLHSGEAVQLTVNSCSACPAPARGISALSFSPGGERLLVSAPPISAIFRVAGDGGSPRSLRALTGITLARWLSDSEIVTAGADGVLLVSTGDGAARSLSARPHGSAQQQGPPTGLGLSPGGQLLCTGEREGRLDCYTRSSRSPPAVQLDLPARSGAESEQMAGLVISHQGRQLTVVALPDTTLPVPGYEVAVLRYTAHQVGPLMGSAWREVARATVRKIIPGYVVELRLLEPEPFAATSPDPKKKNPFRSNTPVKLTWSIDQ